MSLANESIAVITGAASGIGRALAVLLAKERIAGIAIADVNTTELNETARMIEGEGVRRDARIIDVVHRAAPISYMSVMNGLTGGELSKLQKKT